MQSSCSSPWVTPPFPSCQCGIMIGVKGCDWDCLGFQCSPAVLTVLWAIGSWHSLQWASPGDQISRDKSSRSEGLQRASLYPFTPKTVLSITQLQPGDRSSKTDSVTSLWECSYQFHFIIWSFFSINPLNYPWSLVFQLCYTRPKMKVPFVWHITQQMSGYHP